ncbi:septum site-determining protein MinD, partial [uncultured Psychrobacter sp.]
MAKIVVITSGKGGVGKTTTSASFAAGLALRGYKTVVIDFDVGLRNLDLIMGCENRIVYDFVDVINGNARLSQALVKDKQLENLYILPASQTRDKDALTDEGVAEVMDELSKQFDYIICDSPAGIERGAQLAMYHADEAIIVTNPEISSVRDSDRIIGILQSQTKKVAENQGTVREHLIITRYNADRAAANEMMDIDTISNDI